jgi:DNA-binding transcriptional regulator YdaS (Cro superfamily)
MDKSLVALEKAIENAGSQAELGRRISRPGRTIKQQHIWNWLNRDKKVPPEVVLDIERETGVSRHILRGDIYPIESQAA